MKTEDIETAIATLYCYRKNVIVPRVRHFPKLHECDLLIINKAGWATEIEIKISLNDLKKDLQKEHQHQNVKIRELYYAVPEKLFDAAVELLPDTVGLIKVTETKYVENYGRSKKDHFSAKIERFAVVKKAEKFTPEEVAKVTRLGTLRIWYYKEKIIELQNKIIDFKANKLTH